MVDKEPKDKDESEPEKTEQPKQEPEQKQEQDKSNPVETQTGVVNDLMNKVASLKQEIIDYIDLKFANAPIAKVEKTEPTKKELPK